MALGLTLLSVPNQLAVEREGPATVRGLRLLDADAVLDQEPGWHD